LILWQGKIFGYDFAVGYWFGDWSPLRHAMVGVAILITSYAVLNLSMFASLIVSFTWALTWEIQDGLKVIDKPSSYFGVVDFGAVLMASSIVAFIMKVFI